MPVRKNGEIVTLADSPAQQADQSVTWEVEGQTSAELRLRELGQVAPAGIWRTVATGGQLLIQAAATMDALGEPATWTTWWTFDPTTGIIIPANHVALTSALTAFVAQLYAIGGADIPFLWTPQAADTTGATTLDRLASAITFDATVAARLTRLGSGYQQSFDGATHEGDTPDADRLSFGDGANDQPFSIVALVKPDVNNAAMEIFAKYDGNAPQAEYFLGLTSSGHPRFKLFNLDAASSIGRRYATAAGTDWVLLIGTYDGTKSLAGIRLYVNGVRLDDTDDSSGAYTGMSNGSAVGSIGYLIASGGAKADLFDGNMALVALIDKALSPAEVWGFKAACNAQFGTAV